MSMTNGLPEVDVLEQVSSGEMNLHEVIAVVMTLTRGTELQVCTDLEAALNEVLKARHDLPTAILLENLRMAFARSRDEILSMKETDQ